MHELSDDWLIVLEVIKRHDAPGVTDAGDELLRDGTFVESARSLRGNRLQCRRKIRLNELVTWLQRCAVGPGKDFPTRWLACQTLVQFRQCISHIIRQSEAVTRQRDGWREQIRKLEFAGAVFFQRKRKTRNGARNADTKRLVAGFFGSGFPSSPRNISRVAAAGALSR